MDQVHIVVANSLESSTSPDVAFFLKEIHRILWIFMDLMSGITFFTTKQERFLLPYIAIDQIKILN